jgi:hypothetical protein
MSATAMPRRSSDDAFLAAARWVDVVLLVAAAPFVILMGAPVLGFVVAAVAWIVTRLAAGALERRAQGAEAVRTEVFLTLVGRLGRAWALGLVVLAVGLIAEREDGLTAALTLLVLFTVSLIVSFFLRPTKREPADR